MDLVLRGAAIGTALAIGLVLVTRGRTRGGWSVLTFAVVLSCYLLVSAPGAQQWLPALAFHLLVAGAALAPFAMVWMMLEILTDRTPFRRPILGLAGLGALVALVAMVWEPARLARGVLVLVVYIWLVILVIRQDADDLIAARRVVRRVLLALIGGLGIVITIVEMLQLDSDLSPVFHLLQAGGFWGLALAFGLWALQPEADLFAPDTATPTPASDSVRRNPVITQLNACIAGDIWRREGLTITDLAREVGVPEHRLRAIINRELGWRNFSTFINHHRIAAARARLSDPSEAQITILQIAYDCGFASIGPFNRAFRDVTGQTPSAYRAEQLGAPAQNPRHI